LRRLNANSLLTHVNFLKDSAIVRTELLRVGRIRAITLRTTFHFRALG
jgi:hypothetical protein